MKRLIGTIVKKDGMICLQSANNPRLFYPLEGNSGIAVDFQETFNAPAPSDGPWPATLAGKWGSLHGKPGPNAQAERNCLMAWTDGMSGGEHIFEWARNTQSLYRRMLRVRVPGNFVTVGRQAAEALDGEEEFPAGTTDGLADIYDEWLTENFPEALWPGHRLSADELLHEVFALMEKATEDEKPAWQEKANWLDRFLEKWEKVQQAGDFAASNARGE